MRDGSKQGMEEEGDAHRIPNHTYWKMAPRELFGMLGDNNHRVIIVLHRGISFMIEGLGFESDRGVH